MARTRALPVRLLGMKLSNLGVFQQLSLFEDHEKVGTVVDDIRERYGFSGAHGGSGADVRDGDQTVTLKRLSA